MADHSIAACNHWIGSKSRVNNFRKEVVTWPIAGLEKIRFAQFTYKRLCLNDS